MSAEKSSTESGKPAESGLHIMEAGFKPRPELFEPYLMRYGEFLQYAIRQPGFRESYGGAIPGGPWWFAVSKFASLEDMERFQLNPAHVEVQNEGRDKWWTAYYIRKGRLLAQEESVSGRILCETAILRNEKLSPVQAKLAEDALAALSETDVLPYETLVGENLSRPYMLAELAGIEPARACHYILLTYWPSTASCDRWVASTHYRKLESLGKLASSYYQIVPERKPRMMLRPDRMQREWVADK
ncbi:MAG TPA: hypothetical protein VMB26_02580 [Candidatus Binataceae bacterium]|nr:hypothetical protein [Candidatus Binataceae bacterium]